MSVLLQVHELLTKYSRINIILLNHNQFVVYNLYLNHHQLLCNSYRCLGEANSNYIKDSFNLK